MLSFKIMHEHLICGNQRLEHTALFLSIHFNVFRTNTNCQCYYASVVYFINESYEGVPYEMKAFTRVPIPRNTEKPP